MNLLGPVGTDINPQLVVIPGINQLGSAIVNIVAPTGVDIQYTDRNGLRILTGGESIPGAGKYSLHQVSDTTGDVSIEAEAPLTVSYYTVAGVRGAAGYISGFPNSVANNDSGSVPAGSSIVLNV